ncbi:MAG TPA: AAA family ATPase [Polyangia bacterium]
MILRKLHLQSFRCFGAPVEIGPLDPHLTVIHGPNGIGKSTLLVALERGLFDRPDSQAAEMDALAPWGASVQPKVAIDFSVGEERYRIEKSFGPRGQALLSRGAGARLAPWKEGTGAVEWLRDQLGGRQPPRGATRPEHRGLAQVLFVPQGALELPERLGEGAIERLRAVVQSAVLGGPTRAIESELRRRHAELFTAGGQAKKGAPLPTAREQLALAEAEQRRAEEELRRRDETALALETAERALGALESRRKQLALDQERLAPRVKQHRALREKEAEAKRALEAATRSFDEVAERIQTLADLRHHAAGLEARAGTLAAADETAANQLVACAEALAAATAARAAHEAGRATLTFERGRAEAARAFCRAEEELSELGPRLARLVAARAESAELSERLRVSKGHFSGQRIRELRELLADERSARERLSALKLRVTIRARERIELVGPDGPITLAAGQAHELSGEGALALTVGAAELEIAGPAVDLDQARSALAQLTEKADALARTLGSRDPSELEVWRAEHKKLDGELALVRARAAELAGGENDEALTARLELARRARERLLADHPEWGEPNGAPEPHRLEAALREAEQRFESERHARAEVEAARVEAQRVAQAAREAARSELAGVHDQGQLARGRLETASADGLTDAEREARRRELSRARQQAEDALHLVESALAELPGDPETELDQTRRAQDGIIDELRALGDERARLSERLAEVSGAAPHARLAEAEERAATLSDELARAELDADATHLLFTLFNEEHARLASRLVGPVVSRVAPRLRKLSGARFERLELDENLRPRAIGLVGVERPVGPDELSYGTRDQLALLVRLALGELVAGSEPLPAVLDDPLVHADRARHRRLLQLLEESARTLQLIILTCRPEDYRPLASATFLDLAAAPALFPLEG